MNAAVLLEQLATLKARTDKVHAVVFEDVEDAVLDQMFAGDDEPEIELTDDELDELFK